MDDIEDAVYSLLVRVACIILPPWFLLTLSVAHERCCVETWKVGIAGCIVLAWSVANGCWMLIARRGRISSVYRKGVRISLYEHAFALCVALLALDHGLALYAWILTSMLYWMTAGVIVTRRSVAPTGCDRFLIAHGFLLLYVPVAIIVWEMAFVRYFHG